MQGSFAHGNLVVSGAAADSARAVVHGLSLFEYGIGVCSSSTRPAGASLATRDSTPRLDCISIGYIVTQDGSTSQNYGPIVGA